LFLQAVVIVDIIADADFLLKVKQSNRAQFQVCREFLIAMFASIIFNIIPNGLGVAVEADR